MIRNPQRLEVLESDIRGISSEVERSTRRGQEMNRLLCEKQQLEDDLAILKRKHGSLHHRYGEYKDLLFKKNERITMLKQQLSNTSMKIMSRRKEQEDLALQLQDERNVNKERKEGYVMEKKKLDDEKVQLLQGTSRTYSIHTSILQDIQELEHRLTVIKQQQQATSIDLKDLKEEKQMLIKSIETYAREEDAHVHVLKDNNVTINDNIVLLNELKLDYDNAMLKLKEMENKYLHLLDANKRLKLSLL